MKKGDGSGSYCARLGRTQNHPRDKRPGEPMRDYLDEVSLWVSLGRISCFGGLRQEGPLYIRMGLFTGQGPLTNGKQTASLNSRAHLPLCILPTASSSCHRHFPAMMYHNFELRVKIHPSLSSPGTLTVQYLKEGFCDSQQQEGDHSTPVICFKVRKYPEVTCWPDSRTFYLCL